MHPKQIPLVAVFAAAIATTSSAGEIQIVRTSGEAWFETCYFFGFVCETHGIKLPKVVVVGDVIQRVSGADDFGPFAVHSIRQESNGNCFLYNSPYRDLEGVIYLGKCEVLGEQP